MKSDYVQVFSGKCTGEGIRCPVLLLVSGGESDEIFYINSSNVNPKSYELPLAKSPGFFLLLISGSSNTKL